LSYEVKGKMYELKVKGKVRGLAIASKDLTKYRSNSIGAVVVQL
jgi:hypothetical protein